MHPPKRPSFNHHLRQQDCDGDLRHLLVEISIACKYIAEAIAVTEAGLAGSVNQFGEEQLKLDVLSDDLLCTRLRENGSVRCFVSEERDEVVELSSSGRFAVAFDPLDGSSLVEANFSIGTIVSVYEAAEFTGLLPGRQKAALYVLYGPRTILVCSIGKGTHMYILNAVGEFILLEEHLGIADEAKHYSPGNLRALADNPGYETSLRRWLDRALTLRYSGCLVADTHHILTKGQGIFVNVGGSKYPQGKLRHLIECGPLAFLVVQAGGAASDGAIDLLEKPVTGIDQRTPVIMGSRLEVEKTVREIGG